MEFHSWMGIKFIDTRLEGISTVWLVYFGTKEGEIGKENLITYKRKLHVNSEDMGTVKIIIIPSVRSYKMMNIKYNLIIHSMMCS